MSMNVLSYTTRSYAPGDHQRCLSCFISNVPEYFTKGEIEEYKEWLELLDKDSVDPITGEKYYYYVISNAEQIVGCGGFALKENKKDIVFTWGLIDRQFHKKGYGKALFDFRLNEARLIYPGLNILLDTSQHSFKFFQKQGFGIEKITPDFYAPGLDRYDMKLVP